MIDLEALARHAAVAADRARQILLAAGTPEAAETKADGTPVTATDRAAERAIRETLKLTGGNREQTAKMLGIGERTLYRKLKEYGLR